MEPRPVYIARVRNGRLTLDEPTHLPEGTEVELSAVEPEDALDAEDLARLNAAILAGEAEADRGEGVPAAEVIAMLDRKRQKHDR